MAAYVDSSTKLFTILVFYRKEYLCRNMHVPTWLSVTILDISESETDCSNTIQIFIHTLTQQYKGQVHKEQEQKE
jgi:hypothetical protein